MNNPANPVYVLMPKANVSMQQTGKSVVDWEALTQTKVVLSLFSDKEKAYSAAQEGEVVITLHLTLPEGSKFVTSIEDDNVFGSLHGREVGQYSELAEALQQAEGKYRSKVMMVFPNRIALIYDNEEQTLQEKQRVAMNNIRRITLYWGFIGGFNSDEKHALNIIQNGVIE